MRESKSITVDCEYEQTSIDVHQCFGWELVSSQEVFSQESHLEKRSDGVYNTTTTINYVKLVFSRDTNMPNYHKIAELEEEFFNLNNPVKQKKNSIFKVLQVFSIIASVILWVVSFTMGDSNLIGALIAGNVFCIASTIACPILHQVLFQKKADQEYARLLDLVRNRRAAILEEVENYV